MDQEGVYLRTVGNIKDNIKMIRSMVKVRLRGLTVKSTKVAGILEGNMGEPSLSMNLENRG
jgi:hypothetical protein